jgi:hypothetical protein
MQVNVVLNKFLCKNQVFIDLNLSVAELKGHILEAQAAISLTVGSEIIPTITSFTLHELAMQPHLQTRL